ncbi:4-alpha-glucanotransferase [Thiorhodospira sibirica]|uniref:4-alpha-glucanotransferase n=1 Tax=Thiorhodospira sibirica TaxID=154347 RepID=UPI0005935AD0|nr:4-alpha-glucanotransferase [Thiorhodospira sibirica]
MQQRRGGVLLHPTSLPGPAKLGTLGADAYRFVDWLERTGMAVWQMLPLNQTHPGGSPYQCLSVHGGNVQLICLEQLGVWGWLDDLSEDPHSYRNPFDCAPLQRAYAGFMRQADEAQHAAYQHFISQQAHWLDDYALFLAIKNERQGAPWWEWDSDLRTRNPTALAALQKRLHPVLEHHRFAQYVFYRQWRELKAYANQKGILLFGDMPIFVAHDSADVWAQRTLFDLDEAGRALTVAGVPPDYFSSTGQRWGNPHYNWVEMEKQGFSWWIERIDGALELLDLIRIDHFRGFEAYWSIPAQADTAMHGHWVQAPGVALFERLKQHFGVLPLVAEDLGIITAEVEALRDQFGLPGMKILQFAFGGDADNPYLPHHHVENCVVYTGTHDNDTSLGWFSSCTPPCREHALAYLGQPQEAMPWPLIRCALASTARLAVIPLQDLLSLDTAHRMNTPGTVEDNWSWRFAWEMIPEGLEHQLRHLLHLYGRDGSAH